MKERLLELLFEQQLRMMLTEFDPDRVFRWISNNCVIFGVDRDALQKAIVHMYTHNQRRTLKKCRLEIIYVLALIHFPMQDIIKTVHAEPGYNCWVYKYKAYGPLSILPAQFDDATHQAMQEYLNGCHRLKEYL